MNRFAVLCLMTSLAIGACFYSMPRSTGPGIPTTLASYVPDADHKGSRLIGMQSANDILMNKWNGNNKVAVGYTFSRVGRSPRFKPMDALTRFDEYQPNPKRVFIATFRVYPRLKGVALTKRPFKSYPIIIDRISEDTLIFAQTWQSFDKWLATKDGVDELPGYAKGTK